MEEKDLGSVNTGSLNSLGEGPANAGEPDKGGKNENVDEKTIPIEQYKELESKLGSQGEELGQYRNFVKELEPLLSKLQGQEDLVNGILDGVINSDLAKAVIDGKVSIADAKAVAQANDEVKKEMGTKGYKDADPATIEKMVSEKVKEASEQFNKKFNEVEERRSLEREVDDFISNTPDFDNFAEGIQKFFAENPTQFDIKIAYNTVKGEALAKEKAQAESAAAAEAAKRMAANAGPGGSQGASIQDKNGLIDSLIGAKSSPNHF